MANSDSRPFNPDEGEELLFREMMPTPAAPVGEPKIAPDVWFAQLGRDLVQRLNNQFPSPRMTQDGVNAAMAACTNVYITMLHEMTPGSSPPETPYVDGTVESILQRDGIDRAEAVQITARLQAEIFNYITERQERSAEAYQAEVEPNAAYVRLKQREMYRMLSTTPWEDAKAVARHLELAPSTAERFTREYVTYLKESNKRHVATANLMPKVMGVATDSFDPSNRIAEALEASEASMEKMIAMLTASASPIFPQGELRDEAVRQFLVSTLHGPNKVEEPHGKCKLDEPSDYRFIVAIRQQMEANPDMAKRFDNHVSLLQTMADNVLDPNKISQYTNTLIYKQGRELAVTLQEAGIENSREVAARIANIFTKQVNLVQSSGPDSHAKA
jgi:hypothetical protein